MPSHPAVWERRRQHRGPFPSLCSFGFWDRISNRQSLTIIFFWTFGYHPALCALYTHPLLHTPIFQHAITSQLASADYQVLSQLLDEIGFFLAADACDHSNPVHQSHISTSNYWCYALLRRVSSVHPLRNECGPDWFLMSLSFYVQVRQYFKQMQSFDRIPIEALRLFEIFPVQVSSPSCLMQNSIVRDRSRTTANVCLNFYVLSQKRAGG